MKLFNTLTLLLILALFALPVLAQSEAPTESPAPLDYAAFAQLGGVALVVYVVMEIAKKTPVLRDFDAFKLSGLVTLLLYFGYQIVFIYGGDVGQYLGYLADIGHFGDAALNIFATFAGATGIHHVRKNTGDAIAPKATMGRPLDS